MSVKSLKTGVRSFSLLAGNTPEHHVLIAESTVGAGGAASITFSNIPADYQHLQIRGIAKSSNAASTLNTFHVRLNSDSATNYSWHQVYGYNNATASAGATSQAQMYPGYIPLTSSIGDTSLMFGGAILDLLDYSSALKNKTLRALMGLDLNFVASNPGCVSLGSGLWMSTAAVNSVTLLTTSGNFAQHSTFALYGVK